MEATSSPTGSALPYVRNGIAMAVFCLLVGASLVWLDTGKTTPPSQFLVEGGVKVGTEYNGQPATYVPGAGDTFSVNLTVDPNGYHVIGGDIALTYNFIDLEYVSGEIVAGTENFTFLRAIQTSTKDAQTKSLTASFASADPMRPGFTTPMPVVKLTFKRLTNLETAIQWDAVNTIIASEEVASNALGSVADLTVAQTSTVVCTAGQTRCSLNDIETCKTDGSGWEVTQACSANEVCTESTQTGATCVVNQPAVSVSVTKPVSNDTLTIGQTYPIEWVVTASDSASLANMTTTISLTRQVNGQWQTNVIADNQVSVPGTNTYQWTVDETAFAIPEASDYFIKVELTDPTIRFEGLAGPLTISAPVLVQPAVTVTSPNGGERVTKGQPLTVIWQGENMGESEAAVTAIKLVNTLDNTQTLTITPPDNSVRTLAGINNYTWTVPSTVSAGDAYKIQVEWVVGGVSDMSDAVFSVIEPPQQHTTIKLKLGNVSRGNITITAAFSIKSILIPLAEEFPAITFTSDANGVFVSTDSPYTFQQNVLYTVLVKGPKHRQIEFENIQVGADNVMDLTGKVLEPGDLPWNEGVQDGVINLDDLQQLEERIDLSFARTPSQADLDVADLNYDGRINAFDRSILLNALNNKPDDF